MLCAAYPRAFVGADSGSHTDGCGEELAGFSGEASGGSRQPGCHSQPVGRLPDRPGALCVWPSTPYNPIRSVPSIHAVLRPATDQARDAAAGLAVIGIKMIAFIRDDTGSGTTMHESTLPWEVRETLTCLRVVCRLDPKKKFEDKLIQIYLRQKQRIKLTTITTKPFQDNFLLVSAVPG